MIRAVIALISLTAICPAEDPLLDFTRGLLAESHGNQADASKYYESAAAAAPDALPLAARVAARRLAAGDLEGAATLLRTFAEHHQDRLDAQLHYADFLRESCPNDGIADQLASETLQRALIKFPGNPAIASRLFRALEARHLRDQSLALFQKFSADSARSPETALAAADMARVLFNSNDPAGRAALDQIYESSIAHQAADPALARAASEYFRATKRPDRTISALEAHACANPSSLDLRTRLGILQLAANHTSDGELTLREILAIDPQRALAHQALAKLYRQQNKPDAARTHAAELLKIRGGEPSEYLTLADEWLAIGDARSARLLLEKGAFRYPDSATLAAKLAIATRRDPETRRLAPRLFREAEALAAAGDAEAVRTPEFLAASADAFIESGESNTAEQRLRDAIRSFPPDSKKETATALRRLAGLWESEHRNASAAQSLRHRADSLDPPSAP
jgi:predicted Zn-dependent protease